MITKISCKSTLSSQYFLFQKRKGKWFESLLQKSHIPSSFFVPLYFVCTFVFQTFSLKETCLVTLQECQMILKQG